MPNSTIIAKKNYDANGNPISIEMQPESHIIKNGKITLIQIPNRFYRVQIDGMTELYEYDNSALDLTEYRVDYTTGIVMFHSDLEGQQITVNKYYGDGYWLISASRVYSSLNESGDVTETLQDIINEAKTTIQELEGKPQDIQNQYYEKELQWDSSINQKLNSMDNKISETETARQNTITATNNANTSTQNANNSITEMNNIMNLAKLTWQNPVTNFAALSTTYPNPNIGWASQTLDDGKVYRWDGSSWGYIATANIVPRSPNYLWVEEKTINKGGNSFTLSNQAGQNHRLMITDLKYQVEWFENMHWTKSGNVITLTESALDETLTFRIINLG